MKKKDVMLTRVTGGAVSDGSTPVHGVDGSMIKTDGGFEVLSRKEMAGIKKKDQLVFECPGWDGFML